MMYKYLFSFLIVLFTVNTCFNKYENAQTEAKTVLIHKGLGGGIELVWGQVKQGLDDRRINSGNLNDLEKLQKESSEKQNLLADLQIHQQQRTILLDDCGSYKSVKDAVREQRGGTLDKGQELQKSSLLDEEEQEAQANNEECFQRWEDLVKDRKKLTQIQKMLAEKYPTIE